MLVSPRFHYSPDLPLNDMEKPKEPSSTIRPDGASSPESEAVNSPPRGLWQTPSRRRVTPADTTPPSSTRDNSPSPASSLKYHSDSDSATCSHSAQSESPATSWSSQCDETSPPPQSHNAETGRKTKGVRKGPDGEPLNLSLRLQNLPPWDPWFPDWQQCLSPEPMRKAPGWISADVQVEVSRGLWAPPPYRREPAGLWGQ